MGFYAPFNNHKYVAGLTKNTQFYVPVEGKVELSPEENGVAAYVKPMSHGNERQHLVHKSTTAYTAHQDNHVIKPYLEGENARLYNLKPAQNVSNSNFTHLPCGVILRTSNQYLLLYYNLVFMELLRNIHLINKIYNLGIYVIIIQVLLLT